MNNLYTEENQQKLYKEKQKIKIFVFAVLIIFCILIVSFILAATYLNKTIFQILLSIFGVVCSFFLVYLFSRLAYLKRLIYEFESIANEKAIEIEGTIDSISSHVITLADKSRVYEIHVRFDDDSGKTFYLSDIFDIELECSARYSFVISCDYIKEYLKHEN